MGHVAADCRSRVSQVAEDDATSTRTPSTLSQATTYRTSQHPQQGAPQSRINRLSNGNEPLEFTIYTPPDVPVCEFFDLRQDDDDVEDGHVGMISYYEECGISDCMLCEEPELCSTSTLFFDMSDGEPELACESVRAVRDESQYEEVILDSGADITVLPLRFQGVGSESTPRGRIQDAQGNTIPTSETRAKVMFEVQSQNGERLFFRDKVLIANVQQPLFCIGKLLKDDWLTSKVGGSLVMEKGSKRFPIYMSRNSLAASMRIHRIADPTECRDSVRMVVEIPEELEKASKERGWTLSPDGVPMHVEVSDCTVDPSNAFPSKYWPFRATLIKKHGREYEVFESGEYWEDHKIIYTYVPSTKMITLLSLNPVNPRDLGKVVKDDSLKFDADPSTSSSDPKPSSASSQSPMDVEPAQVAIRDDGDGNRGAECGEVKGQGRAVPEQSMSVLEVNGVQLTEESSLRKACKHLRISPHGSKAILFGRIQSEMADMKTKAAVQVADSIVEAFKRVPEIEAHHGKPPSAEEIELHEVTHFPRMPWCSACVATRSREDAHSKKPSEPVGRLHVDFMFCKTEKPNEDDHPLMTFLVAVDEHTNYVVCIPVKSKAAADLGPAVEEITKLATLLGHQDLSVRGDTEPSMTQLLKSISAVRSRLGQSTRIEHAPPESSLHQGLKAERFIQTVRNVGKCLLSFIEEKTGFKVKSSHPLFPWSFRHAAFLYTRFHVLRDGMTPFELATGRPYRGKLVPFGMTVLAQVLPKTKSKAEPWKRCVFLGRSVLGNLCLVADAQGIHYARSVRRGSLNFDTELIVSMKGVPWNSVLDVIVPKKLKLPRFRMPELFDAKVDPGPDEAASDPPSPAGNEPPSVVDAEPGEGNGVAGSSAMSTNSSAELVPDHEMTDAQAQQAVASGSIMNVITPEFCSQSAMLRRIPELDRPTAHEDVEVPELDLEFDLTKVFKMGVMTPVLEMKKQNCARLTKTRSVWRPLGQVELMRRDLLFWDLKP